jgi:hypothetical protein
VWYARMVPVLSGPCSLLMPYIHTDVTFIPKSFFNNIPIIRNVCLFFKDSVAADTVDDFKGCLLNLL